MKRKKRVDLTNNRRPLLECRGALTARTTKSKAIPFGCFVGVDQTGAVKDGRGKEAKPLRVVVASFRSDGKWHFFTEFKKKPLILPSFDQKNIEALLMDLNCFVSWKKTALVIDCVLGLPKETAQIQNSSSVWDLFFQASDFQVKTKEYGREVAEAFFLKFFSQKSQTFPKRECERWSHSNSVFQVRPYQKNIQTGTFRFWKEMGKHKVPWAKLWPFDALDTKETQDRPWIFEGYPSLIWSEVLRTKKRAPVRLKAEISKCQIPLHIDTWGHVSKSQDHADAFVLAFGGVWLQEQKRLQTPFPGFEKNQSAQKEGWIMGLSKQKT